MTARTITVDWSERTYAVPAPAVAPAVTTITIDWSERVYAINVADTSIMSVATHAANAATDDASYAVPAVAATITIDWHERTYAVDVTDTSSAYDDGAYYVTATGMIAKTESDASDATPDDARMQ